jgi:phenylalanyl-tRNA synthetase beta chain
MINSLSADLDVLRPSMVETGLETISYNINRKNKDLQLFEFGKTYHTTGVGNYLEREHLSLYLTGESKPASWKSKATDQDFFEAKGIASAIIQLCGLKAPAFTKTAINDFAIALTASVNNKTLLTVGEVSTAKLKTFDIKQPVYFIDIDWLLLLQLNGAEKITYKEVSKFPAVQRDLALVVDTNVTFESIENVVGKVKNTTLQQVQLFDIFESDKLGKDKKSMAVSFTFLNEEKTMTDKEIDSMMNRLIQSFETELQAEIRK